MISASSWASFMTHALGMASSGRRLVDLVCGSSASSFSPPTAAAWCSRNGVSSLARLSKYKELIAPERLDVKEDGGCVSAVFSGVWDGGEISPALGAAEFVFLASLMRRAADPRISPVYASVKGGFEGKGVEEFLGCRIEDAGRCEIRFKSSDMAKPFSTWSFKIWDTLGPALDSSIGKAQGSLSSRVVGVLQSMLPSGESSIDDAASRLCTSPRTLQRRLAGEGATFHKLLASPRLDLACRCLGGTTMSVLEAAFLLGYDEPNSFKRAFAS